MEKNRCDTCQFYEPVELPGWGKCTHTGLWPVRQQEVLGDMYACQEKGALWTPALTSSTEKRTQPRTTKTRIPSQQAARQPTRSPWVIWSLVIGGVGLLLSPVIFIIDLFAGVPGFPEITFFWFILSAALLIIGAVSYYQKR